MFDSPKIDFKGFLPLLLNSLQNNLRNLGLAAAGDKRRKSIRLQ